MEAVQKTLEIVRARDPDQKEFIQAVTEVLTSLVPILEKEPKYQKLLPALVEPERVIMFRVPWVNDKGEMMVNRGFRVQFNSAIGPYKGGCRFRGNVNLSILKFLGFEQVFKNSLTTLPMGGGKGGSDFDPAGKSDGEVMRFCQSFMLELQRHIGGNTDVPAGDIGVGAREIGYMFGQYKRIKNIFEGVLTGKGIPYGGSLIRPEATGYGLVYFVTEMLRARGEEIKGKRAMVSGSGNVSQYCCQKLMQLGAIPVSVSDSHGAILFKDGMTKEHLNAVMHIKNVARTELKKISELFPDLKGYEYIDGKSIWACEIPCEMGLPCATQNEIHPEHVPVMVKNGVKLVAEGANMPSTNETIELYMKENIYYGPGKAANAGGVSVSGLEMTQNSVRLAWSSEKVDKKLKEIMHAIFEAAHAASEQYGVPLYQGANLAGFKRVAEAMLAYGCC
ncbi:glutamate dehydrogenase, putative [Trichomonas vaginalis G3]|uniref:Glutamate dehydrogenase n=1 Tax=Trichomonas vaginalis (strain ATCC PRA-98 / G3) TaxID=412133 RepID=A2DWI3_TRIV3|nr:NADP-specific glutamate dehydrogenase 1-related family [Trichomonas vaginalis G3]EAY15168.1 glutamate dehydrogenase, putative [Trichomonas vaginalis G3]KAI5550682.1 NADP-specific glutamate dehydrogenase 1-related family [Trichomonas vaginalis G3]|eukprot:XP_001327391.1 glutamate dehydrogenase [Trichomonas vaginalis G3]